MLFLLYAVTGGSKKRGKEVSGEEDTVRPSKLTDHQRAVQKRGVKEAAGRGKKPGQGSSVQHPTIDKMPYEEYKKLRQDNPYDIPRNPRLANLNFHSKTQEDIYTNIYVSFKKKVTPHHTIDIKKMRVSQDYFGEAFAMCVEFGILPIMQFNKD